MVLVALVGVVRVGRCSLALNKGTDLWRRACGTAVRWDGPGSRRRRTVERSWGSGPVGGVSAIIRISNSVWLALLALGHLGLRGLLLRRERCLATLV